MEYIPPLITKIREYEIHAQLNIKGHREYASFEVMSYEDDDGKMFIHVIITMHDGSGLRFINDHALIQTIKSESPARKIFYSAIQYKHEIYNNSRVIHVRFFTHKNEEIVANIVAGVVAYETKVPMLKPTGYVQNRELPVGFSFSNRRINHRTALRINNRDYKIGQLKNFLSFRYGSLGRMSDGYTRLNLMSLPERMHIDHCPETLVVGEYWQYSAGKRVSIYTIQDITEEGMTVVRDNEIHKLVRKEDKLYVSRISNFEYPDNVVHMNFNPPLPVAPHKDKHSCKMIMVNNDVVVFEAVVYNEVASELNTYYLEGDSGYPVGDATIRYEVRVKDGWILSATIM